MDSAGKLFWITGLSGAGKSTIGRALYAELKRNKSNVVYLDGDSLRGIFGNNFGHNLNDRRKLALCYSNLCKMLTDQGIDVVCATMSLFKEVHEFNRATISRYIEVFVECDMQELIRRDQKGIYSKALRGEQKDVIGVDLPYDHPENCDLVINNTDKTNIDSKVELILNLSL